MEQALVIGDSGGIGGAIRAELEGRGVAVTGLSRSRDGLDVTDEASVEGRLGALDGPFDLVFVASGALHCGGGPEKTIRQFGADEFLAQMRMNARSHAQLALFGITRARIPAHVCRHRLPGHAPA